MKVTRIGWVGKTQDFPQLYMHDGVCEIDTLWEKGKKEDWVPADWPPRKIRVTVEDIK